MKNVSSKQQAAQGPEWTLVRQGSHLVPYVPVSTENKPPNATTSRQRITCVFVVDQETACEVRARGRRKGGGAE